MDYVNNSWIKFLINSISHSFGYDCYSKMFNLCAVDNHIVVYAAGSYICILDIKNGGLSFRKCVGNGTIGHITVSVTFRLSIFATHLQLNDIFLCYLKQKNSVFSHLAVGENCDNPLIVIYEWPKLEIVRVLKGGSKKQINWLTYRLNKLNMFFFL